MKDYYKILGVNSSATHDEIRRAYRILARRYHPDVNPGKSSEDKFKTISAAYEILSDPKKRSSYDLDYERIQLASYAEKFSEKIAAQFKKQKTSHTKKQSTNKSAEKNDLSSLTKAKNSVNSRLQQIKNFFTPKKQKHKNNLKSISIIEISVNIKEALYGQKKTIEIPTIDGNRKISVNIPPGVKSGSVLRLKHSQKNTSEEEIVLIIRVAHHPYISIQNKGLVVEVPVSIQEALFGANITLPTLDEAALVKIPPSSQSGSEIRLKNKGILQKDGQRGDLIYKLQIKIPQSVSAVGLKDKINDIDKYYEEPVRKTFPANFNNL